LETVSYRAVLARGFALVRGGDGHVKRRAESVKPAENLTLTFADGETKAVAAGKIEARPVRRFLWRDKGQGDLF
jgi:exodeoxyribonuclease VII large subunit